MCQQEMRVAGGTRFVARAHTFSMPTACEPWPGNRKATGVAVTCATATAGPAAPPAAPASMTACLLRFSSFLLLRSTSSLALLMSSASSTPTPQQGQRGSHHDRDQQDPLPVQPSPPRLAWVGVHILFVPGFDGVQAVVVERPPAPDVWVGLPHLLHLPGRRRIAGYGTS